MNHISIYSTLFTDAVGFMAGSGCGFMRQATVMYRTKKGKVVAEAQAHMKYLLSLIALIILDIMVTLSQFRVTASHIFISLALIPL